MAGLSSQSSFNWEYIEKLDSEVQRRFLRWQLQAREPIRRFCDMRVGDHLVRKGSASADSVKYEHHFLRVGFNSERGPLIIHYYKTSLQRQAIVQVMTLPNKDFIENEAELQAKGKEVERVVWPEELKRFPVPEVITRALKYLGEDSYHLTKNNSESFIMRCLCDVNITLQGTPAKRWEYIESEVQRDILGCQLQAREPIRHFSDKIAGDILAIVRKGTPPAGMSYESVFNWKYIEKLKGKEQRNFLKWQLQAREPIRRFSDMRVGDHLIRKASVLGGSVQYEHHFICIGFDSEQKPKISHYYNTARNAIAQMFPTGLGSGTAFEQLGIVQEMTLPHEDFIKNEAELQAKGKEVERVVWPEELRRYSVEEIIKRAEERKGEDLFDLIENNCESFVMWCMCGLNITLQVTPARKTLCEAGRAFLRSIWHAIQQLPKMAADLIDDVGVAIGAVRRAVGKASKALPKAGVGVGAAVTVVIEVLIAAYDIYIAYKKWKDGKVEKWKTREHFIKEVTDKVILALCRSGWSIGGMFVGQLLIPIPIVGGLVGAVVGLLGGHAFGKLLSKTKKAGDLAHLIEKIVAKKLDNN